MTGASQMIGAAPILSVADVVRAHDYYAEKLGFRSPRMWGDPPTFCIPQRDGVALMLSQVGPGEAVVANGVRKNGLDAYFWVRDVDALFAEFGASGADIACGPQDYEHGMREVLVRDLDGHVLCFGHDIGGGGDA